MRWLEDEVSNNPVVLPKRLEELDRDLIDIYLQEVPETQVWVGVTRSDESL